MLVLLFVGFICRRLWVIALWLIAVLGFAIFVVVSTDRAVTADLVVIAVLQSLLALALGRGASEAVTWLAARRKPSSAEVSPADDYLG